MMYIGLLDEHRKEIPFSYGYRRVSCRDVRFMVDTSYQPDCHFRFFNSSPIDWPNASRPWPQVHFIAFFRGEVEGEALLVGPIKHVYHVDAGEHLRMAVGQLEVDSKVTEFNLPDRTVILDPTSRLSGPSY